LEDNTDNLSLDAQTDVTTKRILFCFWDGDTVVWQAGLLTVGELGFFHLKVKLLCSEQPVSDVYRF
jgi:hypothetical protein